MIHIALGFDQNYSMPTGVLMLSICMNTPGPVCFHALIAPDVSEATKKTMQDMVASHGKTLVFHVIDPGMLKGMRTNDVLTLSTYNRILIPEVLPPDVTKAIYLDCDTITLSSLQPLWDIALADDEPLGMTYDWGTSNVQYLNKIGIPMSQVYCNAGVLLMNLECWRREKLAEQCLDLLSKRSFQFLDQDAINIVIGRRIKHLHFRYNLQYPFMTVGQEHWLIEREKYDPEIYEAMESPVVIHYSGSPKPWCTACELPDQWMKYKNASPWKDVPLVVGNTKASFPVHVAGAIYKDYEAAESIASPLMAIVMKLSVKHHKAFVLLRKALWTVAKKRHLIED